MYLYFSVGMYIITVLSHSDSCMYWFLAYIREGISDVRIYVAVASPYPRDRSVIGWYLSLGSNILSTSSWQINDVLNYSWRAWVLNIHSNRKCGVIYSFLAIISLDPETLLSFQLLPVIPSIKYFVSWVGNLPYPSSYYHRFTLYHHIILGKYNLGVHNSSLQQIQPLHLEARHHKLNHLYT